jgi:hypothetical protein
VHFLVVHLARLSVVPKQRQQNDYGQRNAQKPKQRGSTKSHCRSPFLCANDTFTGTNALIIGKFHKTELRALKTICWFLQGLNPNLLRRKLTKGLLEEPPALIY